MEQIPTSWEPYLPIRVTVFNELTYQAGTSSLSRQLTSSRKMSSLFAYLLLHSEQNIPVQELLEVLWPDSERDDPINALKTLVYRARLLMKRDGIPYHKECILALNGTYRWNPALPCEVDAVLFENAAKAGLAAVTQPEQEKLLRKAISLYRGELLPQCASEEWIIPLNTYYRSLYVRAALALLAIWVERREYQAVVDLSRQALSVDSLDEALHGHLLQALGNLSQTHETEKHYVYMKELFAKKLGLTPSEHLRTLYQKIIDSEKRTEADLTMISKDLQEPGSAEGAFVCEYSMFKQIYRLKSRMFARDGIDTFIALLTLRDTANEPLAAPVLNTAMNQLLITTQGCLRKNDVITRYSGSQYVLLLPASTAANAKTAVERIQRSFLRQHPRSPAVIHFSIQPLGSAEC